MAEDKAASEFLRKPVWWNVNVQENSRHCFYVCFARCLGGLFTNTHGHDVNQYDSQICLVSCRRERGSCQNQRLE